jgi:aminoglycoside phosphotransferase (APT) family kinase protein
VEPIRGSRCWVTTSADGAFVEKRFDSLRNGFGGHRYPYERRVGELLRRHPPPVPTPRLVRADRRRRVLVYEAVQGETVGPKFPLELDDASIDALVDLAVRMPTYRPARSRFVRRFDLRRRIRRAVELGALLPDDAAAVRAVCEGDPPALVLGHGDITARNVMRRHDDGVHVLIDWEWFAIYPRPWDLAFLWLTLVDVAGARQRVELAVEPRDEAWFWRSALLVQVLHLGLAGLQADSPFRARHIQTRDELLERVLGEQ